MQARPWLGMQRLLGQKKRARELQGERGGKGGHAFRFSAGTKRICVLRIFSSRARASGFSPGGRQKAAAVPAGQDKGFSQTFSSPRRRLLRLRRRHRRPHGRGSAEQEGRRRCRRRRGRGRGRGPRPHDAGDLRRRVVRVAGETERNERERERTGWSVS